MTTPQSHPDYQGLLRRISALRSEANSLKRSVYRSANPAFASKNDFVSGTGAKIFGGRWNPQGIAAVYGSLTPEAAMAETLAHSRHFGLSIGASMPRVFVEIEVVLTAVLDLSDGHVRQRLRVSRQAMLEEDWHRATKTGREALTQAIGRAVKESGLEGLLAPSAAMVGETNLVVFPANLKAKSGIAVTNADKLGG